MVDSSGLMHPLESLDSGIPLFFSGSVLPETEPAAAKGAPKPPAPPRVERVAVTSWAVGGEKEAVATVSVVTELATYVVSKPTASYKKLHQAAVNRAVATREALRALCSDVSGESADPSVSVQQVCANIARANGSTLSQAKEVLVRAGKHVLSVLRERDVASGAIDVKGKGKGKAAAVVLSESPFAKALAEEMATFTSAAVLLSNAHAAPGGIVIKDGAAPAAAEADESGKPTTTSTAQMTADEAMARALFEQEMAREEGKARKSIKRAAASAAGGDGCGGLLPTRLSLSSASAASAPTAALSQCFKSHREPDRPSVCWFLTKYHYKGTLRSTPRRSATSTRPRSSTRRATRRRWTSSCSVSGTSSTLRCVAVFEADF